jgi:Transposase
LAISEQTDYKWRREYGGLKIDQANRLKDLERENERLKKAVSQLTLDKQILKGALSGKYKALLGSARALSTCARSFRFGASCVRGRWAAACDAAQYGRYGCRLCPSTAGRRRLAGQRPARLSHLAPGRAQCASEASET